MTLTLDDHDFTVSQVFGVTLLDPCDIATLSFTSQPLASLPTVVALRDATV